MSKPYDKAEEALSYHPEPLGVDKDRIDTSAWEDLMCDVRDGYLKYDAAAYLMHHFFPEFEIPLENQ